MGRPKSITPRGAMGCNKGGSGNSEDSNSGGGGGGRALRSTRKMGRPPTVSNTRCRFLPEEVAEMERLLVVHNGQTPSRSVHESLAEKFSKAPARRGQAPVRPKQVWNWFQNRRYKLSKQDKAADGSGPSSSGRHATTCTAEQLLVRRVNGMQFEAVSRRDGAWYDIRSFLEHRFSETGEPEVCVRYAGFGAEEDEWIELKAVRRRSLPCEGFECLAVYPGDRVLCFQEGDEHALYYDARVVDVQRKRHDARGCRCRFWIRYDHDQFEEVVPLRKVCRRPDTDARLKQHFGLKSLMTGSQNDATQAPATKLSRCPSMKSTESDSGCGGGGGGSGGGTGSGSGGLSIDLNVAPPAEPMPSSSCSMEMDNTTFSLNSRESEMSTGTTTTSSRPGGFLQAEATTIQAV